MKQAAIGYVLLEMMPRAVVWLHAFQADRRAVTAIEYALIAGVIFLVIIVSVTHMGDSVQTIFTKVSNGI